MPFECTKCNKLFKCKWNLDMHLKRLKPCISDEKYENISCPFCNNTYSNKYNLKNHVDSCTVKKNPELLVKQIEKLKSMLIEKDKIIEKREKHIDEDDDSDLIKNTDNSINNSTITNNTDNSTTNITVNIAITNEKTCAFRTSDMISIINDLNDTDVEFQKLYRTMCWCAKENDIKTAMQSLISYLHDNPKNKYCQNLRYCKEGKYKGNLLIYDYDNESNGRWQIIDICPVMQILSNEFQEMRRLRENQDIDKPEHQREKISKKEEKNILKYDEESLRLDMNINYRNMIHKIIQSFKISVNEKIPSDIDDNVIYELSDSDGVLSEVTKKYLETRKDRHNKMQEKKEESHRIKHRNIMMLNEKQKKSSVKKHNDDDDSDESYGKIKRSPEEEAELQKRQQNKEREDKRKDQEKIERDKKAEERSEKERKKLEEKARKLDSDFNCVPIGDKIPIKIVLPKDVKKTKKD